MTARLGVAIIAIVAHLGWSGVGAIHAQSRGNEVRDTALLSHESPAGAIAYRLHVPDTWVGERRLLVMLHGCLQDSEDFAAGTRMNEMADRHGFAVLWPEQNPEENPQRCWNWFLAEQQAETGPEVSRITSLIEAVTAEHEIPASSVDLAGMSAGAAMANILAVTHPDRFGRLALHSGIAWGAASNLAEGLAAMQSGGPTTVDLADPRLRRLLESSRPDAVLVIQGAADPAVAPVNGLRSADWWAALLRARGAELARGGELVQADPSDAGTAGVVRTEWTIQAGGSKTRTGDPRIVLLAIEELAHAWSGGDTAGSFTAPGFPAATELIVGFFGLAR